MSTSNLLKLEKLISDMVPSKAFEETSRHLRLERISINFSEPKMSCEKLKEKELYDKSRVFKLPSRDKVAIFPSFKDKCCRKLEELMCKSDDDGGLRTRQEDRLSVLSKESFEIE
nr:hypothetical protein Iba_chr09dCG9570 [Ipomoea batatas]